MALNRDIAILKAPAGVDWAYLDRTIEADIYNPLAEKLIEQMRGVDRKLPPPIYELTTHVVIPDTLMGHKDRISAVKFKRYAVGDNPHNVLVALELKDVLVGMNEVEPRVIATIVVR